MLNLNLSLLTLTFFIFFTRLVLLCLFQIFNDLFFVLLSSSEPKADTKVVQLFLPTKFFNDFFQEKFSLFSEVTINQ